MLLLLKITVSFFKKETVRPLKQKYKLKEKFGKNIYTSNLGFPLFLGKNPAA